MFENAKQTKLDGILKDTQNKTTLERTIPDKQSNANSSNESLQLTTATATETTNGIESSSDDPEATVDLEETENPCRTNEKTLRNHPISSDYNSIKQRLVGKCWRTFFQI